MSVTKKTKSPVIKWAIRLGLAYIGLLALTLAVAIIVIFVTFTFVIIDAVTDSDSLGVFAETYFVPVSEFMWDLFTSLVPGL
ncbi:hypothetical protein [Halalkalibacterium ligniniphilum]|uniref:hypothetical protein n=1 Tax=Halalkalibacterium ligniniphilum TaxID=1134413 RepID=UPI00034A8743|nr:hypothetical protein [Halalkalibacterium ligniniphilum]